MPRYIQACGQNRERIVIDMLARPPQVMCVCDGRHGRRHADDICEALEMRYAKFDGIDDVGYEAAYPIPSAVGK